MPHRVVLEYPDASVLREKLRRAGAHRGGTLRWTGTHLEVEHPDHTVELPLGGSTGSGAARCEARDLLHALRRDARGPVRIVAEHRGRLQVQVGTERLPAERIEPRPGPAGPTVARTAWFRLWEAWSLVHACRGTGQVHAHVHEGTLYTYATNGTVLAIAPAGEADERLHTVLPRQALDTLAGLVERATADVRWHLTPDAKRIRLAGAGGAVRWDVPREDRFARMLDAVLERTDPRTDATERCGTVLARALRPAEGSGAVWLDWSDTKCRAHDAKAPGRVRVQGERLREALAGVDDLVRLQVRSDCGDPPGVVHVTTGTGTKFRIEGRGAKAESPVH